MIDLNTATREELEDLPMICPGRAQALVASRPLRSWQEVALLPGFDFLMAGDLRRAGATLGEQPLVVVP